MRRKMPSILETIIIFMERRDTIVSDNERKTVVRIECTSLKTAEKENVRNLAAIQKIHDIKPIPGADHIELIHVLGWQCVHGSVRSA